jgi:hypothetical protein
VLLAIDIDGTADCDPPVFLSLMQALRCAGHRVVILTGCSNSEVVPQDIIDKETYLTALGLGEAYDQLVVFADPPAEPKAEWIKNNGADMLIDNNRKNCELASQYCTALLPWSTREGSKS